MANAMREQVNGTSPQDIMKINENFESMWYKLHGDVDFEDTNKGLKNKIQTQYIPVQGEGNFDKNYPLYVRFYIPPNAKEIKSSSFNAICENYRMDSGVAEGGGGIENVDLNISMGNSSISCSVETSEATTHPVWLWFGKSGNIDNGLVPPLKSVGDYGQETYYWDDRGYYTKGTYANRDLRYGLPLYLVDVNPNGSPREEAVVDAMSLNHVHKFPGHSHTFIQQPHSHSGNGRLRLDPHTHPLKEGIKVSTTTPQNVVLHINNEPYAVLDGSNTSANNVDITKHIKMGEWNVIKVTTSNLARITIYGTIELILKY